MDAFEKAFQRGIPLEKAASFFVNLKNRQMTVEEDIICAAAVKVAAEGPPPPPPVVPAPPPMAKSAAARFDELVHAIKTAGEDGMPASSDALAPTSKKDKGGAEEYIATERAGQEAEDSNALVFYQQKLEELRQTNAQLEQEATDAQAQVEQLSSAQEAHQSQLAASQQEMQIASQAAMQQVQAANQMATQSMQAAVEASNQALTAKATETTAKIQQQGLRTQLFDLASQGVPGTEPELGDAGNAAEGLEPTADPAAPAGSEQGDMPAEAGAEGEGAEGAVPGDAEAGLNEGAAAAPADGTGGPQGDPSAAEATPDAVPPGGDVNGNAAPPQAPAGGGASASPTEDPSAKRSVSIKVGFDLQRAVDAHRAGRPPTAEQLQKTAAALPEYLRRPEIIGALAGGIGGAGLAGAEAAGHGPDLDKRRAQVAELEAGAKQPGLKGFGQAFELAKEKALLTLGEATQNHPVAATITGGLLGAGAGYAAGPEIKGLAQEAISHHKD